MAPLSTDRHTGKRGVKTALSRLHASLTRAHRQMLQPRYGIYPALGLLVVGVLALAYQRSDLSNKQEETRRTELERIRSRGMATDSARAAYGAAMVAALAPTALSGNRLQRRRALQALAAAAPTSAADLAGVIFETSTSAEEKEFARQINMRASLDEMDRRFMGHIRVARELHHERFFRESCDEFSRAFEAWSDRLDAVIDHGTREAGNNACGTGRVLEGSTNFLKAVQKISSN